MDDHHRNARMLAQLEDTRRQLQQLLDELEELLELRVQVRRGRRPYDQRPRPTAPVI